MIGPKRRPGPRPDVFRQELIDKFSLGTSPRSIRTLDRVDQIYACKDDSARRLLLGISKKVRP
jgi:hypothetical protein